MRRLLLLLTCGAAALAIFGPAGTAGAAASVTVTPSQNLTQNQRISVTGSGFQQGPGAIVECNSAPNQPTVQVAGNPVPVGCTNPLNALITADANGNVPSTQFTVQTGTIGPAASGKDSSGNDASADAAKFPCPPTAEQQGSGVTCVISVGDSANPPHQATQAITFQATTTTASTTTTVAATTATNPPVVQQTTETTVASTLSRTGAGSRTMYLALVAVIVLDAGYLLFSSTRRPRPLFRRHS